MKGKRVKLIRMEDPYTNLKSGDMGTVEGEDSLGQILVKWDNGSNLSLLPDIDEYIIERSSIKIVKWNRFFELNMFNDIDYINAKMEELSDLIGSAENSYFEWSIEDDGNSNFLECRLSMDDEKICEIEWFFDIKELILECGMMINGDKDQYSKEMISVESGMDTIEKDIHHWMNVSESY